MKSHLLFQAAFSAAVIVILLAVPVTGSAGHESVSNQPVVLDVNGHYPLSGSEVIDVQSYELHFYEIDYVTETISASAALCIKAVSDLTVNSGIPLDFAPPGGNTNSITSLTVDASPCPFSLETCTGGSAAEYETYLKIIPAATIPSGTVFSVALAWSGHPNKETTGYGNGWGMDFRTSPDVVTTMNQPNSAHLWFPCNDTPADKATYDVYGTVGLDQWAISVGELAGVTTNGSERTFHWRTDFNVAPYLIAFNAGDYMHVSDVGGAPVPVEAWYYDGSFSAWKSGAEKARDNLNTYTNIFGPYPFEKYAHVQFWNSGAAYMEHQTISSMKDNNSQYIAHELAHQWWGDYVTCETWNDLWLNEGFAVYSEQLAARGVNDRDGIANDLPSRANLNWTKKLNQPGYNSISDLFNFALVYNRGAWMIHHLRNYMGEDRFWSGILHYKSEYGNSSADTEDFRNCLAEDAFDNPDDQESFKSFFDRYLEDAEPELSVNWYAHTLNGNACVYMYNSRTDGFDCGDVVVSRLDFTDGSAQTVFHRFTTNLSASVVIVSNKTFAAISIDEYGDFPCNSVSDLSVSGGSDTTDGDGDGLPDQWEMATLGTLESSAMDDPDGDGINNATEYAHGTLPGTANVNELTAEENGSGLIAYEGFEDYTDNTCVLNLSGGTGWTGNWSDFYSWNSDNGSVKLRTTPMGFMSGDVFVAGGTNAVQVTPDQYAYISRTISETNGEVYVSFLVTPESSNITWGSLGTPPGFKESGFVLHSMGYKTTIQDVPNVSSVTTAVTGQTEFVVLRYDWDGSTYTGVSLWVSPDSSTDPGTPNLTQSGSIGADSISEIYFGGHDGAADTAFWFDEIRVGTNWNSVVPSGAMPCLQVSVTDSTIEIGSSTSAQVSLSSQPACNVNVAVSVDPTPSDLSASTTNLTFTPANWEQPQSVTIHSADNDDEPVSAEFTFTPDSSVISAVVQTFAEAAPFSFSCHDDFSGNDTGWSDGSAWSGNLAVSVGSVAVPLVYSNESVYVNGGGDAVKITSNVGGTSSYLYSRAIPEQTDTFYISFLVCYKTASLSTWDYLGCGQKVTNGDTGAALGHVNSSAYAGVAYINDGATTAGLDSTGIQAETTYMIVAKYVWDDSQQAFTTLTAYLNPLSATEESAQFSATISGTVIDDFDSIDFQYYGTADADFDEIRVGRSWSDVVPATPTTPEPVCSVTVTLAPSEAISAGVQWGIIENSMINWYESGETVELDPGTYSIVYSSFFQYISPPEEDVTVASDAGVTLTRYYTQSEPVFWQEISSGTYDIFNLGDSQSATNGNGLLAKHFGVYPELQTVEEARLNGDISIDDTADLIGSMDRFSRPQNQTWVFNWSSLKPTLHTNTTDWGECDWIGLHTPSVGFDLAGSYSPGADDHPYGSKTGHTNPNGNVSTNDFYPSGGEYYDMEGIYFDNDAEYFYISVISTAPFSNEWINADGTLCRDLGVPETASARTTAVVPPGDIAFDFGLNTPVGEADGATFSYDFGIDLTHEVREPSQWYTITHTYSNSASSTSSFSYDRPPIRNLDAGTGLYRTQNTDWYLALASNAAIRAGLERSNFDPQDSSSSAIYQGEVQSSVYRLDFPQGRLENDLPTYVYEFVVPRALFGGAETNRNYIKVRFLPTTCRNDGNNEEHVFYLNNVQIDEPEPMEFGALGNRAWFDKNGNGIQDDEENNLGVTNIQVVAVCQNTGAAYTNYTDELGYYLFDNMPEGYYDIYFDWPENYSLTSYNTNPTDPERGHYVDANIGGITDVYVTAGATNLNADVGFKDSPCPLSTQIDLRAYDSGNGIMLELSTADENGSGDIEIYAWLSGKWHLVAVVDSAEVVGFEANTYIVEATGLTAGRSYKIMIIDEAGHIFDPVNPVKVERNKLKTVYTRITAEHFTMVFETTPGKWYVVQYSNSLNEHAKWKNEYVQIIHDTFPDGVSDYLVTFQGAPEGQTKVRIPKCHQRAFYRIVEAGN
jgi:hypothetical protein